MENKKVIASETVYIIPRIDPASGDGGERMKKSVTEYDEAGRQVRESTWDLNGNYEQIIVSTWDEHGRLDSQEVYLDEKHLSETHSFEYDMEGRLVRQLVVYAEGGQEEMVYTYDGSGNLIRKEFLGEDGEQEALELREYMDGRLVSERREEYGELSIERILEYEDGRLVRERVLEDLVETLIIYGYDEEGRLIDHAETVNGKPGSRYIYKYDMNGLLAEEGSLVSGVWHTTRMEYDAEGNEQSRVETLPDGSIILRVRRTLGDEGRIMATEVEANTMGIGIDRHYRYLYEYTFH